MRPHPHTSIYVPGALLLLLLSGTAVFASESEQQIEINAPTIELSEDGLSTQGPTTIQSESLRATGAALRFERASGLFVLDGPLVLRSGPYALHASALSWTRGDGSIVLEDPAIVLQHPQLIYISAGRAACTRSGCRLEDATLTTCPADAPCSFHIQSIDVEPDQTVVIRSATLRFGRLPVFYLPWLKLMPNSKPGLLPPRVAYFPDTGLVLGPGLYLPVADQTSLKIFAAGRFAGGVESSLALRGPAGHLQLEYGYLYRNQHTLRARSQAKTSFSHGSAAVDLDIVNHLDAISQFTFWPDEKIRSHNASRARATLVGENLSFETTVLALQPFAANGDIPRHSVHVRTGLGLNVIAMPIAHGLFADLRLGAHRLGLMAQEPTLDSNNSPAQSHSRFDAQPTLAWSHNLGPLSARASLGSHHRIWLTDLTNDHYSYHAGTGAAELSLPLLKRIGSGFHWIEPAIRYRNNLLSQLRPPPHLFDFVDQPRIGQGIELLLRTHFDTLHRSRLIELSVAQRFDLDTETSETPSASYLYWSAALGPPAMRLSWRGAFDERQRTWSLQRISLRSASSIIDVNLGYEYIGLGLGPHLDRPELYAKPWPAPNRSSAGIYGSVRLKLPIGLQLHSGAHLSLPPAESTRLDTLYYGAVYRTPCPLIRLGLYVSHFGDSLDPSAMLVLTAI